jgi:hypothetical protein
VSHGWLDATESHAYNKNRWKNEQYVTKGGFNLPIISQFYGILIYIYKELGGQHGIPHFHAKYSEYESVYDFEGNLIAGELPKKQRRLVEAWCELTPYGRA